MNRVQGFWWLVAGASAWLVGGCLPFDQELEALFAPEAVGNALFVRDSVLFELARSLLAG